MLKKREERQCRKCVLAFAFERNNAFKEKRVEVKHLLYLNINSASFLTLGFLFDQLEHVFCPFEPLLTDLAFFFTVWAPSIMIARFSPASTF